MALIEKTGILLLADVVDYTPQVTRLGNGKTLKFNAFFQDYVRKLAQKFKGDFIKSMGADTNLVFRLEKLLKKYNIPGIHQVFVTGFLRQMLKQKLVEQSIRSKLVGIYVVNRKIYFVRQSNDWMDGRMEE